MWADNLFVLAGTAGMVEGLMARCTAYEHALGKLAWRFSASSLEVLPMTSVPQPLPQMQLSAGNSAARDRITSLGVCLDLCRSTKTMVRHQLDATTKVFGKWRHLLATLSLAVRDRMHNTYDKGAASYVGRGGSFFDANMFRRSPTCASWCAQCRRAAMDTVGCGMLQKTKRGMGF